MERYERKIKIKRVLESIDSNDDGFEDTLALINKDDLYVSILLKQSIKTIIPIEDWELLGDGSKYRNSYNLTQTTLSLPIYPSLTNEDVLNIVNELNKVIN